MLQQPELRLNHRLPRPAWSNRVTFGVLLTLAWLILWGAGLLVEFAPHASIWFPPAGLSFAALVILGRRAAPWLALAAVLSTFWSIRLYDIDKSWGEGLVAGLSYAAAHLASYGLAAWLMQQQLRRPGARLPAAILAFLLAAALGTLVATGLQLAALMVTGMLGADELASLWLPFWIGDFVAIVALAPLLGAVLVRCLPSDIDAPEWFQPDVIGAPNRPLSPYLRRLALVLAFVALAMALAAWVQTLESVFVIFFILIPMLWLTFLETPLRSALALGLASLTVALGLALLELDRFAFVYQFAVAVIGACVHTGMAMPLLAADNRRLRRRVKFDGLTGVASRDFILEQARLELARSAGTGRALALMIIDLDHFKRYNDRYGHARGDALLLEVAAAMASALRPGDVLGRYGGDEFIALLPDAGPELAGSIAERIRMAVSALGASVDAPVDAAGDPLIHSAIDSVAESSPLEPVGVSLGWSLRRDGDDFQRLFERADQALYRAKARGRGRIESAPGG